MQAWAEDMAAFVKGLDPNHLVMLGTIGMFGASTPALTKQNPFDLVGDTMSKGGIYSADPICQVRPSPGQSSSACLKLGEHDAVWLSAYPLAGYMRHMVQVGRGLQSIIFWLLLGCRERTSAALWA